MRRSLFVVLTVLCVLGSALPAAGQTPESSATVFHATLTGSAEVPDVDTDGAGTATVRYVEANGELDFLVTSHGLDDVTQAHIHLGAAEENGPVVVPLFGPVEAGITRDGTLSRGTITEADVLPNEDLGFDGTLPALLERLRNGTAYVNVHTVENPAGEIRGQVTGVRTDAGFTDIGGAHANAIRLIAGAGITEGRTPTTYAPEEPVRRKHMALFLSRAFNLPPATDDFFDDDDDEDYESAVNAIAAAGITLGCTDDDFCPDAHVTREQMASFLARALALGATKTDIEERYFGDVSGQHAENITLLAAAGITTGVTPTRFRPNRVVRRDHMATFLARAREFVPRSAPVDFELAVLHNNDGESALVGDGDIGGVARFAHVVDQQRDAAQQRGAGSIMLSSGDNFLAGPAFTASQEHGVYYDALALEAIDYDAIALGNHDFDFGPDVLADFIAQFDAPPPFLSANLDVSAEQALQELAEDGVIEPSTVVTIGGQDIGVVGATTPALRSISSPRDVEVDPDVAARVQAEIDDLTADGVEVIILISHLQSINEDLALAPNLSNVDIMIAGGGDELLASEGDPLVERGPDAEAEVPFGPYPLTAINRDGTQVPVVTTQGSYTYLGQLVADFNALGDLVDVDDELSRSIPIQGQEQDAGLLASVVEPVAAFEAELAETVIGTSEVQLNGLRNDVRTQETNYGNLIADSFLWQAEQLAGDFDAPVPDVALQNGGGIRDDTTPGPGDITALDTFTALPFANFLAVVPDVPRTTFKAILENAVSNIENVDGRFAQVAGFSFTYDPSMPARMVDDAGEVTAEGSRIRSVTLDDGTQIVEDGDVVDGDDLAVATIDFLARGGDGYPFGDAEFTSLGVSYQQALSNYIQQALGGTITAEGYPEGGEGRITAE